MRNNPLQDESNNAKHQFSNSEPLTHAQKLDLVKQMSKNKQSSVEWLFGQFLLYPLPKDKTELFKGDWVDIFEQAKAMHKEEITKAWKNGDGEFDKVAGEMSLKYYNETFGGNK